MQAYLPAGNDQFFFWRQMPIMNGSIYQYHVVDVENLLLIMFWQTTGAWNQPFMAGAMRCRSVSQIAAGLNFKQFIFNYVLPQIKGFHRVIITLDKLKTKA